MQNRTGETYAEIAKSLIGDNNYDPVTDTYSLPTGWSFVGAGAHRTVFLGPDGYVYKVQHDTDNMWQENANEWYAYEMYADEVVRHSEGLVRLAKPIDFFTDSNVLVMEYEPCAGNALWCDMDWTEYYCAPEFRRALRKICLNTEIDDLHGYNVYFNLQGEIVIVDYAC